MPQQTLQPPLTPLEQLNNTWAAQGFAVLGSDSVCALAGVSIEALQALQHDYALKCQGSIASDYRPTLLL